MSLTRTRAWVAGTVVLCLLLSVAAWFLLVSPQRDEAAQLDQQRIDTQSSNAALQIQIDTLAAQYADLPSRQAELAAMRQAIPEDAGIANLVRDLDGLATSAGVTIDSVTPGVGTLVGAAAAAATAAPAADASGAASTDATGTVSAAAPSSTDQLVSIPLTVTFTGDFFDAEQYVRSLQTQLTRAYLVTGLTFSTEGTTSEDGSAEVAPGTLTGTVIGSVFVFRPADSTSGTGASATAGSAPVDTTAVATN